MKTKNTKKNSTNHFFNYIRSIDRVWLKTWLFIYIGFLALDAYSHLCYGNQSITTNFQLFNNVVAIPLISHGTFIGTTILKYIGIVLNFIYALQKFPKDHLLHIALAFTLLADTILCIDSVSALGVLIFCFAQFFHTTRFADTSSVFFIIWNAALIFCLFIGNLMDVPPHFMLGAVYAILLFTNIYFSYKWHVSAHNSKTKERETIASSCALYGFILFACCDLCVGLSFFSYIGLIPSVIYEPANYFSWAFYYISQLLIANSSTMVDQPSKKSFAQK